MKNKTVKTEREQMIEDVYKKFYSIHDPYKRLEFMKQYPEYFNENKDL